MIGVIVFMDRAEGGWYLLMKGTSLTMAQVYNNASPGMLRAPLAARLGRAQQVPGQLFPLLPRRRRRRLLSRENIGRMGKEMLKRNTGKTLGRGETKSGLEKQRRSTRGETGLSRK